MGLARRGFKSMTEDKMATGVEPVVHLVPEQQKYFQGRAFLDDARMLEESCQYLRAPSHSSAAISMHSPRARVGLAAGRADA